MGTDMSTGSSVFEWFSEGPLPALLPDPAIVIGGTGLLREFFSVAAAWRSAGSLSIAVPYIGRGIVNKVPALQSMRHELIELSLIARHRPDAQIAYEEMSLFPWRAMNICIHQRLHAKIYTFTSITGAAACLVGSHNLSQAGADKNVEAGTLFLSSRRTEISHVAACYQARIAEMLRESEPVGERTSLL